MQSTGPLHSQLASQLAHRIESGEWPAGSRFPSTRQLAQEFDVSSFTVTSAIRELQQAGKVTSIQGKGTFVVHTGAEAKPREVDYSWQNALLRQSSPGRADAIIRPLLSARPNDPDVVMLAGGGETIDVLPLQSLAAAWKGLFTNLPDSVLDGWDPMGERETRTWMANYLTTVGIDTTPDNILVTNGGQQALSLVAQALLQPGDTVLVERPLYPFALSIFESVGARCIDIPVDADGNWVAIAEDLFGRFRPKMLLTVPTGQVPTGVTMPTEQRRRLLEAARLRGIVIVEDDHGSEISYDRPAPPPIKSFDQYGHVIYCKSFSKLTLPALRIGCLVAEGLILEALRNTKLISDRYTSTILQTAFLAYVSRPTFARDLRKLRTTYQARRDAMLAALSKHMPPGTSWTTPKSGFYLWLTLPPGVSSQKVNIAAAANKVVVAWSSPFFALRDPDDGFRLTFTNNTPERIELGVQRLGEAIRQVMSEPN